MTEWIEGPWIKDTAFVITVGCTATCLHFAPRWRSSMPCIFLSLALMGMAWAVLIPYYEPGGGTELLNAFSGLLMVLSGATLRLHGRTTGPYTAKLNVHQRHDDWGLKLLFLMLVPHVVELPFGSDIRWTKPVFHAWVGTMILLIGFWSVVHGVRRLTESFGLRALMTTVVVIYGLLEISYSLHYGFDYAAAYKQVASTPTGEVSAGKATGTPPATPPGGQILERTREERQELQRLAERRVEMPGLFRVGFGLIKILFTAAFIFVLVKSVPTAQGDPPGSSSMAPSPVSPA